MQNYLDGRTVLKMENTNDNALQGSNDFQPLIFPSKKSESENQAQEMHDTPQIELITEDGKIQRIVITCTCCKRIELECQY